MCKKQRKVVIERMKERPPSKHWQLLSRGTLPRVCRGVHVGGFTNFIGGAQDRRPVENVGSACILVKIYCQCSVRSRIRLWGSTPRRLARC